MAGGRVEYTFLWFIENYNNCWLKFGIRSPWFFAEELERTTWSLRVCLNEQKGDDYISVCLRRVGADDEPKEISVGFEFSVLVSDGSYHKSKEHKWTFAKNQMKLTVPFVKIKNVPQDVLTVRCRIWKGEGKVRKIARICIESGVSIENVYFLHAVKNFSSLAANQKNTTETQSRCETECCVISSSLYFTYDSNSEGEMIVEMTISNRNRFNLWIRNISLVDVSGNLIQCIEKDNCIGIQKLPLSLTRQVILSKKSEYLPDDILYLRCECTIYSRLELPEHMLIGQILNMNKKRKATFPSKNDQHAAGKASAYPGALEDVRALYVNRRLTDVVLKTDTRSFPAHKVVLCARSAVFEAMLTNDMKEKNTDCIRVDDLGDDVVEQMLLFLYSDDAGNLQWDSATRLYYAGDKYQIGKLKEVCSSFLLENLTTSNAMEVLLLADTHSDSDLKKTVEDFILKHEEEVFGSKEWETLMKANPLLAVMTMHSKYKK